MFVHFRLTKLSNIYFLTLSMLSVLSFIIDACASLSNIALKIFLLWIGWCFRKISMMNFLLNMVRAISFRTRKRNRGMIYHIIWYLIIKYCENWSKKSYIPLELLSPRFWATSRCSSMYIISPPRFKYNNGSIRFAMITFKVSSLDEISLGIEFQVYSKC